MQQTSYVTIGRLSREADVLPSTIRFYIQQGLLAAAGRTPGGFLLFELDLALARIRRIQELQRQERLTLAEIRERLVQEGW